MAVSRRSRFSRYKKCLIDTINILKAAINDNELKADFTLIQTIDKKNSVENEESKGKKKKKEKKES